MARVLAGFVVLSLIPWPTTAQVVESGVVVGFSQAGPNGPARDNVRPATVARAYAAASRPPTADRRG